MHYFVLLRKPKPKPNDNPRELRFRHICRGSTCHLNLYFECHWASLLETPWNFSHLPKILPFQVTSGFASEVHYLLPTISGFTVQNPSLQSTQGQTDERHLPFPQATPFDFLVSATAMPSSISGQT